MAEIGSDLASNIGVSSSAEQIINSIPRFYGPTELEFTQDYAIGVATSGVIGLVIFLLAIILVLFFCCCRTCLHPCCSKYHLFPTLVSLSLISLSIFVLGAISLSYNTAFTSHFLGPEGLRPAIEDAHGTASVFSTELISRLNNVSVRIQPAMDTFTEGLDNVTAVMNVDPIFDEFDVVHGLLQIVFTTPLGDFQCDTCLDLANTSTRLAGDVRTQTNDIIDDINTTIVTAQDTVMEYGADAITSIDEYQNGVQDYVDVVDEIYFNDVEPLFGQFEEYNVLRELVLFVGFLTSMFVGPLVVVGLVLKKKIALFPCGLVTYIVMMFLGLIVAIHLPVALLLGDSCVKLAEIENSGSLQVETFLGLCVEGRPLYKVTSVPELDYDEWADDIKIPNITDNAIDSAFDLEDLNEFQADIEALNVSDYSFGEGIIDDLLFALNNNASFISPGVDKYYDRGNVSEALGSDGPNPTLRQYQIDLIVTIITVEGQMIDTIGRIQNSTGRIVDLLGELKANVTSLNTASQAVINDLVDSVLYFLDFITCLFVGDLYLTVKYLMCSQVTTSVGLLGVLSLCSGILMIPLGALIAYVYDGLKQDNEDY